MARMEILTGRERRRSWSDEKKLRILHEAATSGLSVADVARRNDLVPQQIYVWRRQFLGNGAAGAPEPMPRFLPVAVVADREEPEALRGSRTIGAESPKGAGRPGRIEIRCRGGRVLKVKASLDPAMLRALIRSVEEA